MSRVQIIKEMDPSFINEYRRENSLDNETKMFNTFLKKLKREKRLNELVHKMYKKFNKRSTTNPMYKKEELLLKYE